MQNRTQIAISWLLLFIFPVSSYAMSANREEFLNILKKQAMQGTVDYYNSHRKVTPEMIATLSRELKSKEAREEFKSIAHSLSDSVMPKATLDSDGKFVLEDGQGDIHFKRVRFR